MALNFEYKIEVPADINLNLLNNFITTVNSFTAFDASNIDNIFLTNFLDSTLSLDLDNSSLNLEIPNGNGVFEDIEVYLIYIRDTLNSMSIEGIKGIFYLLGDSHIFDKSRGYKLYEDELGKYQLIPLSSSFEEVPLNPELLLNWLNENFRYYRDNNSYQKDISTLSIDNLNLVSRLVSSDLIDQSTFNGFPKEIELLSSLSMISFSDIPISNLGYLPDSLTSLYLMSCNLSEIPSSIFGVTNLKNLWLSENDILEIDDRISNLSNLRDINLYKNYNLSSISSAFSKLVNLIDINFQLTALQPLSATSKFYSLDEFEAIYNYGANYYNYQNLIDWIRDNFTHYIRGNSAISVDNLINQDDLKYVNMLKSIYMIEAKKLEPLDIPKEIELLPYFQMFELDSINLGSLNYLPLSCKTLYLRECNLREFPSVIYEVSDLTALVLTGNQISSIDSRLSNLTKLNYIDFTANSLTPSEANNQFNSLAEFEAIYSY